MRVYLDEDACIIGMTSHGSMRPLEAFAQGAAKILFEMK